MFQSLKTLGNELKDVTDWRQLGIQLSLPTATLDKVESINQDAVNRKSSMLDQWLKFNPEASWRDLVLALRDMNENSAAKTIEQKYC